MEDITSVYLKKEAKASLNKKLNLPSLGPYSQDWEHELADSSRIIELITFYEKKVLTIDEKFALMALFISSLDNSISEGNITENLLSQIKYLLTKDFEIHRNKITYWALEEENDIENCFAVTPLMREILKNNERNNQ